jgi:hypothetical protein
MTLAPDALRGAKILVVEADSFVAGYVTAVVGSTGGEVLGPFSSAEAALECLATGDQHPCAALLNVQPGCEDVYRVADELVRRSVLFIFSSAPPAPRLPARFSGSAILEKPFAAYQVVDELAGMPARARNLSGTERSLTHNL